MDLVEESFPRGGQDLLTPLEKSILSKQATQDLFQEVRGPVGSKQLCTRSN